ncbi:hypothetical protein [Ligilactobacillus araffinosus]|nr:hypothetical protein [Ligilactobacillus araffinosus]
MRELLRKDFCWVVGIFCIGLSLFSCLFPFISNVPGVSFAQRGLVVVGVILMLTGMVRYRKKD